MTYSPEPLAETEHIGHIILMAGGVQETGRLLSDSFSLPGRCRQLRACSNWHMPSVWRFWDRCVAPNACHRRFHRGMRAGRQSIMLRS